MLRILHPRAPEGSEGHAPLELIASCAQNRDDSVLWSEFLRRYGLKIKQFIRGTLRTSAEGNAQMSLDAESEEKDLFQSTILRLVEHDCAAMKRFSGSSEQEWLAYLAVITRSVVRDALRHRHRRKRMGEKRTADFFIRDAVRSELRPDGQERVPVERGVLAAEIRTLCEQQIQSEGKESGARDLLIFRLYFDHDLTLGQIATCRGVNLSKTGVEKVINRLKERVRNALSPDASEAMM
jgi:RNA polymerase sigma factor (sigma-70 family)